MLCHWHIRLWKEFFFHNDYEADLTAILVLSHYTDALIASVDEQFRLVFLKQAVDATVTLNPFFLLAWVNVFESMRNLMKDLSDLGMALHSIKNVEALLTI